MRNFFSLTNLKNTLPLNEISHLLQYDLTKDWFQNILFRFTILLSKRK